MQAAKLVNDKFPKSKFLVVGEGILQKKLERMVFERGLRDKFIFTGWRENIPDILKT